jgi:hypothetical protein
MASAEKGLEKEQNRLINLYDPPKDLHDGINAGELSDTQKRNLNTIIQQLFSPDKDLPDGYAPIADTKKTLMDTFGFEGREQGYYGKQIADKLNSLMILREKYTTGHDARPTGLYVSQDTGPNDVVKDPQFIITPGTVLDPAGKTKGGADYSPIRNYESLEKEYIERLNMKNIINSIKVTKTDDNEEFVVSIQTTFDGEIGVTLNGNFDPKDNEENGTYFQGNPTKNEFIKNNKGNLTDSTTINKVKKYLLVKELGDTLQVEWLRFMLDKEEQKANLAKFNRGNTVIITNDTVVFFRSLVNKVGVILTYKGKSRWYKAMVQNEATLLVIEQSLVKTIGDEVIRANKSVINLLEDVVSQGKNVDKSTDKAWVGGNSWDKSVIISATNYLSTLIKKLEDINKDLSVYFSVLTTQDAARELASRSHFKAPFVWCGRINKKGQKSSGYYKTVNSVTSIMEDNRIPFSATSFTPLNFNKKLSDPLLFHPLPVQTTQAGGAGKRVQRRTVQQKADEAKKLKIAKKDKLESAVSNLLKASIDEIQQEGTVTLEGVDNTRYTNITAKAAKYERGTSIVGVKDNIEEKENWDANITLSEGKIQETNRFFLYYYISTLYPEVFLYAYIVKKTRPVANGFCSWFMSFFSKGETTQEATFWGDYEHIPNNTSLVDVLDVDGYYLKNKKYVNKKSEFSLDKSLKEDGIAKYAFEATKEALALTKYFIEEFPSMNSQRLANLLALISDYAFPDPPTVGEEQALAMLAYTKEYGSQSGGNANTNKANNATNTKKSNPLMAMALDIYEIYYSLAIKASYENKTVSDFDFTMATTVSLLQNMESFKLEIKNYNHVVPVAPVSPTLAVTGTNARNRALITGTQRALPMISAMGGRRAKTQKKRKAGRKTRKQHKK